MLVPCWLRFVLACLLYQCACALPQDSWLNISDSLNLTAGAALPLAKCGQLSYTGAYAPGAQLEDFTAVELVSEFASILASRTAAAEAESEVRLYYGPLTQIQVSLEFLHLGSPMEWHGVMLALQSLVAVLQSEWARIGRSTFQAILSFERIPFAMISVSQEVGARTVISGGSNLSGEGRRFRSRRLPFQIGKGLFDQAIFNTQAMMSQHPDAHSVPNGFAIELVAGFVRLRCLLSSHGSVWPVFTGGHLIRFFQQVQGWFSAQGRYEGYGLELYYNAPSRERIFIGHLHVNQEYFAPPLMLGNTSSLAINGSTPGETVTVSSGWNVSSNTTQYRGGHTLDDSTITELDSEEMASTGPGTVAIA